MENAGDIKRIVINEKSEFFNKTGMFYKEFPSDYRQIRYFTLLVVQMAPPEIKEINLLEQQVSELIKNAVKHGNKNNVDKKVKIWYKFETDFAHLIVEDEGEGFNYLEDWKIQEGSKEKVCRQRQRRWRIFSLSWFV